MFKQFVEIFLLLQLFTGCSFQQSLPTDASYVVGVVEFRPELLNMDIAGRTAKHLKKYKKLLRSKDAKVSTRTFFCVDVRTNVSATIRSEVDYIREVPSMNHKLVDLRYWLS